MTELSFLIHLLLDHKLPAKTKASIKDRIGELEQKRDLQTISHQPRPLPPHLQAQAPSMQAKVEALEQENLNKPPFPTPVAQATTYQAAKALEDRQKLINQALTGKEEPGRVSPRKF